MAEQVITAAKARYEDMMREFERWKAFSLQSIATERTAFISDNNELDVEEGEFDRLNSELNSSSRRIASLNAQLEEAKKVYSEACASFEETSAKVPQHTVYDEEVTANFYQDAGTGMAQGVVAGTMTDDVGTASKHVDWHG
ncbi:hypothetical protein J8273_0436 [Carpediemonas membranifera]|uniref:Uncharacterized protein n=1 Tax=Carpediemonas membranifera TaxID=201153 RepID=A0A8J6E367_9EUKA|nr:hypothetical protein J8273_0436 [Carpediemonas membranifera]|eukprot:KAG9395216.1 hypothetical protein J8273_0436 [Carpediemonas membranifera]